MPHTLPTPRRRAMNRMRAQEAAHAAAVASAGASPPDEPEAAPESSEVRQKGVCRKCGDYIGRGVHFHERTCRA